MDFSDLISHVPSRLLPAHASSSPNLSLGPAAPRLEPVLRAIPATGGPDALELESPIEHRP
jgi:hypothetical protein